MGNQLAKEKDGPHFSQVRRRRQKTLSTSKVSAESSNSSVETSSSYLYPDVVDQRQQHRPANNKTSSKPKPVRHQVVLSDQIAPLSSLAASLTGTTPPSSSRRYPCRNPSARQQETLSVSSITSSDDEPGTPTAGIMMMQYSSSVGSSSISSRPLSRDSSSPATFVFDSAIATAEMAAADLKKQRAEAMRQQSKNAWVYEYGHEKEYNRQLRQHYVLKQVLRGNEHVSLDNPRDVLECACGTGLWTLEMAQAYPDCSFVAIDVVPPPGSGPDGQSHNTPANAKYLYGDILQPLAFPDNKFDFVYQRDVANVVPLKKWPALIKEFYRVLRPGGKVELVEYDLLFRNPGPVLALVNEWYELAAATIGVDPDYAESLPEFLRQAGFQDVNMQVFDIPIGEWPSDPVQRQYGFLYKEQMKALFKSMKRWWLSELDVSHEEYDRVCNAALEEFEEYHGIARWKIITATKPS